MHVVISSLRGALQRWGGVLVRPRATLEALGPEDGKHDWWWLAGLFVLGSQIQQLTETVARYQVFRSFLMLVNGFAIALLTPLLVGMIVESIVGQQRARYRHLPLVALVAVTVVANLLRQQGVELPGPRLAPEIVGTLWAAGLGIWIRKALPIPSDGDRNDEMAVTAEQAGREVTHD
jgi:hypothetical protein